MLSYQEGHKIMTVMSEVRKMGLRDMGNPETEMEAVTFKGFFCVQYERWL